MDNEKLIEEFRQFLSNKKITTSLDLARIVSLVKERASFVSELWEQGSFFFEAPKNFDEKTANKAFKPETPEILQRVIEILNPMEDFSTDKISETIKGWITSEDVGFGKIMMPLRLALVGEMKGPEVFDIISVLGKEESIYRIGNAMAFINQK